MTERRSTGSWSFIRAVSLLAATTIGVGIFSLPYVGSQSGFLVLAIHLVGLGAFVTLLQLMYAEVILRTGQRHQMPGYAERFLGRRGKTIVFIATLLSFTGALLANLIIGGEFVNGLLAPVTHDIGIWGTVIFFVLTGIFIATGATVIARADFFLTIALVVSLVAFLVPGLDRFESAPLRAVHPSAWFAPYGVVLFSFWGMTVIPELLSPLAGRERLMRKAVIVSTVIVLLLYLIFSFVVIGISGNEVTENALDSLTPVLGDRVIRVGYLFGMLAAFTTYIAIGLALVKSYQYDFHVPKAVAWALTVGVPLLLFALGLTDFVVVASATGGIFLGIEGLVVMRMYWVARTHGDQTPPFHLHIPVWLYVLLMFLLVLGVVGSLL